MAVGVAVAGGAAVAGAAAVAIPEVAADLAASVGEIPEAAGLGAPGELVSHPNRKSAGRMGHPTVTAG